MTTEYNVFLVINLAAVVVIIVSLCIIIIGLALGFIGKIANKKLLNTNWFGFALKGAIAIVATFIVSVLVQLLLNFIFPHPKLY